MSADDARQSRLAVLIDAENASSKLIEPILAEIASLGTVSVKRIYGDFTSQQMSNWSACLLEYSITPIQQFRSVAGKGASDSALIIDAMDLLYTRRFDAFCIVSSDSDFTRLATRLREDGCRVFGFGEEKTPKSFRQACDKFIDVTIFRPQKLINDGTASAATAKPALPREVRAILAEVVAKACGEEQRAPLSAVGVLLNRRIADFDHRNYGFKKLSDLFVASPDFRIVQEDRNGTPTIYVERKPG